jgi:predicted glycosyltransferase
MKRVFFHVQHLLGIGHLTRAATICRALADAGFEVTLASGGAAVQGVALPEKFIQLPALATADATFKVLIDEHGRPIDDAWKERRKQVLLEAWRSSRADVLIVELFPFGRRQLRFELLPLLEETGDALVVCSVRDLLQRRPGREAEALELVERHFDRVMVHGDPRIVPFELGFAEAAKLGERLVYTGYVVEKIPGGNERTGEGEILVSAGGGAVGRRLLEAAIAARPLTRARERTWRVIAGVNAAQGPVADGVVVERFRNDFTILLRNCELSISQAGYNTVVETLQARARAVVVPFSQGSETEQAMRARLLGERGLLTCLGEEDLSAAALARAVDDALSRPRPAAVDVDLDGARRSAALIAGWAA